MAERRMFAKTIIDSDAFLDMPISSQVLYFHLSMRADDDGFINNPKKIQHMVNCNDDDLKLLIAKSFIIPFESGVCVIKHWKIHNYLRSDRHKDTVYQEEKGQLITKVNGSYSILKSLGIPDVNQEVDERSTQVRLGKDSIGKVRLGKGTDSNSDELPHSKRPNFTVPTLDEVRNYCQERGKGVDAEAWIAHYESNGWKVGPNAMKDWKGAVRTWEKNRFDKPKPAFAKTKKHNDIIE